MKHAGYSYNSKRDENDLLNVYEIFTISNGIQYILLIPEDDQPKRLYNTSKLSKSLVKIDNPILNIVLNEVQDLKLECVYDDCDFKGLKVYIRNEFMVVFQEYAITLYHRYTGGFIHYDTISYEKFTSLKDIIKSL